MCVKYRNSKGYSDPTAGKALENISREEKTGRWIKAYECVSGTRRGYRVAGGKGLQNSHPAEKATSREQGGKDADS